MSFSFPLRPNALGDTLNDTGPGAVGMRITSPGKSSAAGATTADAAAASVPLNEEQLHAAHAPLDKALAVLAAAGTGKTTTMLERCHYMALQASVPSLRFRTCSLLLQR